MKTCFVFGSFFSLFLKSNIMKMLLWRLQNNSFFHVYYCEWINVNDINKHKDHHLYTWSKKQNIERKIRPCWKLLCSNHILSCFFVFFVTKCINLCPLAAHACHAFVTTFCLHTQKACDHVMMGRLQYRPECKIFK